MWNRGSRKERKVRLVAGSLVLTLVLVVPWFLPGPANPARMVASVAETAAAVFRPGEHRLPVELGGRRLTGLDGAPVYELAPDGRGVIVGQVEAEGDGFVVVLPPALAERYGRGAVLRVAEPIDGLWDMVDLLFAPDGVQGEVARLRENLDPVLRDQVLPDLEGGLREALRRFLSGIPERDGELLRKAGRDVLDAIRPELRPVAERVASRAWEVLQTTNAPACAWEKVWALAKAKLLERLSALIEPIVEPLGDVIGDLGEIIAEEGWLSLRTLVAGGEALIRSIGKLPEFLKATWQQLSSLDLGAELDRFTESFAKDLPSAGFGECLSEDVGRRLEDGLNAELAAYWAEHGARVLHGVGEALARYEQPFVDRLKRDLLPQVQDVGLRVWHQHREAIDGVTSRYASDLAGRRLLTREGGPRLPLAYVVRSASGITRRPLLVIEDALAPPGRVHVVPFHGAPTGGEGAKP